MRPTILVVGLATTIAWLSWPRAVQAQEGAPAKGPEPRCKVRSLVVIPAGEQTRVSMEFTHAVHDALTRSGCYKLSDVVDGLEAGVGEGLGLLDEARNAAEAGQKEYLAMRLNDARALFARACEAYGKAFAYLSYAGPYADALMYLGAIEATLGNTDAAVASFFSALRLKPTADVADYSAAAEAQDAFDIAKRKFRASDTGALLVDSDIGPVEVWLDGKFMGATPLDMPDVATGPHWVVLRRNGYVRKTIPVEIKVDSSLAILGEQAQLTPARRKKLYDIAVGKLIKSQPDGSENHAGIEDVKALFLTDMAVVVRVRELSGGEVAHLSMWDLTTMQEVWRGTEPESGVSTSLGAGAAQSLVARAVSRDEERARIQESGAATIKAKSTIWTKWWFWTAVGAVIVGGTTTAVVLTRPKTEKPGIPHDGTGAVILRF